MKINLLVKFNKEKYNFNYAKSILRILNFKPLYTLSEASHTNFAFPAGNFFLFFCSNINFR